MLKTLGTFSDFLIHSDEVNPGQSLCPLLISLVEYV